jgi:tetratricopeptide (TPR) repeat protein
MRALTAIAIERKDHKRALELHQKLTTLGERSVELSYNLGLLLQSVGDQEAAAECYRLALDKKPDFTDAMLNLGHALKAVGKEEEAKQVWSKAVTVDPALASEYFH